MSAGKFAGFKSGKTRLVLVPDQFFTELLPAIASLDELRLCLYFFWRIDRMEGAFRYLRSQDILEDAQLLELFSAEQAQVEARLEAALVEAVAHGVLLQASLQEGERSVEVYLLNSPRGRAALEAIRAGEFRHSPENPPPLDLSLAQPNVYQLYEENIGILTPMIADALREAEVTYPPEWIEEAVRIAVERNKRNWHYVAAILDRWQQEGRDDWKDRRDTEKDRRRYAEWESPSR